LPYWRTQAPFVGGHAKLVLHVPPTLFMELCALAAAAAKTWALKELEVKMSYPLGDLRNDAARELSRILQNLSNSAATGDAGRFREIVGVLTGWLARNGYGVGSGTDLTQFGSYGQGLGLGKSADDAVKTARAVSGGLTVAVQKSLGQADGIEQGVYSDQVLSGLLLMTAGHLHEHEGMSMPDALVAVAKSCPELCEAHARASSNTSRAFWSYAARSRANA